MTEAISTIDTISAQYDKYYDQVKNSTVFKLVEDTVEYVEKASGFKNVVAKPLEMIGKIGYYLQYGLDKNRTFNLENFTFNILVKLATPAQNLITFTECFTMPLTIAKAIRYNEPKKYVVNSEFRNKISNETKAQSKIAYHHYNRLDRFFAISSAVTEWAMSCASWAAYLNGKPESTNKEHWSKPVIKWTGRVLSYTGMWKELKFLYQAKYLGIHRNKENTSDIQGTISNKEVLGSFCRIAIYSMFIAVDIFANSTFAKDERADFWVSRAITIGVPFVFHYFPNFVTKPLHKEAVEA